MPTIRRTLKNVVKNYSDAQVKVREATSNDPWGPSSTLMSEIADFTYNVVAFTEIMQMIWKRLNDDGKNWRHVYKSLVLLDYIVKTGSEKVAQQCKENFHAVKTLTSFQYIDTDNKDQGMNVREKAKQLVQLLSDEERLKNERAKAMKAKERMAQNPTGVGNRETNGKSRMGAASPSLQSGTGGYTEYGAAGYDSSPSSGDRRPSTDFDNARPASVGEEELQLQLALAMSKEDYDEELRRQKSDDIKLQMAIAESQRHAEVEPQASGSSLLDLDPKATNGAHAKDPWGVPLQETVPADPWGAPSQASLGPAPPKADPWGSGLGSSKPQQPSPVPQVSPWGGAPVSSSSKQSTPVSQQDPWSPSPAAQSSPWESPATSQPVGFEALGSRPTTANGTTNIDSEFDLLSSRSENTSPAAKPGDGFGKPPDAFDPLDGFGGASGGNAWGMGDMRQALPQDNKKKPEDFLGANANLVNLDQLVAKAPPKGNNPFASGPSTSNPFVQPTTRVPMNQLQNTAPGFSQPVSTGLLPTPLMPVNSTPPLQSQEQGYNPFL